MKTIHELTEQSIYPISFWNYTDIEIFDDAEACVKDWVDAGMTLGFSPTFNSAKKDQLKRIIKILDVADKYNMKVILWDGDMLQNFRQDRSEKEIRKGCQEINARYKNHPAIFGFFCGDEPEGEGFKHACNRVRILKEELPEQTPFLNLLPYIPGATPKRVGYRSWFEYLDDYCTMSNTDLIGYDCYTQMEKETKGFDIYFKNLNLASKVAIKHDVAMWSSILSAPHFSINSMTEDDFHWQLSTALAHGANAVLYFFLYIREPHVNYRQVAIDEHYERTPTFYALSRVNRTFLKSAAPIFAHLKLDRVRHVYQSWGDTEPFVAFDNSYIGEVESKREEKVPIIISEFTHRKTGDKYIAVVNNSRTENNQIAVFIEAKEGTEVNALTWKHVRPKKVADKDKLSSMKGLCVTWELQETPVKPFCQDEPELLRFKKDFAPGQLELIKISTK